MVFSPLGALVDDLTDESLRTATLFGLASVPFTVVLSWGTFVRSWELAPGGPVYLGGTVSGGPLLVAGLAAGYRYSGRPTASRRAGMRAGIVGALPLVLSHLSSASALLWAGSLELAAFATVLTPVVILFSAGVGALIGAVTGMLGDWLAGQFAHGRPDGTGN